MMEVATRLIAIAINSAMIATYGYILYKIGRRRGYEIGLSEQRTCAVAPFRANS
jgi:hypothetical protein